MAIALSYADAPTPPYILLPTSATFLKDNRNTQPCVGNLWEPGAPTNPPNEPPLFKMGTASKRKSSCPYGAASSWLMIGGNPHRFPSTSPSPLRAKIISLRLRTRQTGN